MKKNSEKSNRGQSLRLAKNLARSIENKKGEHILIFDLRGISPVTDFFVIADGLSSLHLQSIADYLIEYGKPDHIEGIEAANWILLDYIDVIVHLFLRETREFYGLERLWGDVPIVKI